MKTKKVTKYCVCRDGDKSTFGETHVIIEPVIEIIEVCDTLEEAKDGLHGDYFILEQERIYLEE